MIDVVVYISSVLNPNKHTRKVACLENFAEGVRHTGGTVHVEHGNLYKTCRLAVILGWVSVDSQGQNIQLRRAIIQQQRQQGYHTMCIDASCWKYLDDYGTYLRYSLGGPFYDTAEYANHNSGPEKWQEISQALRVQLQPPKILDRGYILICVQRDGGFAMKNLDPLAWLDSKIQSIRAITDRPIVVRPHPGTWSDPAAQRLNKQGKPKAYTNKYHWSDFQPMIDRYNVQVLDPLTSRLQDNLAGAHSAVFFNSSAAVAAVCAGVPVFVDDASCVAWAVSNKDINKIEQPEVFDRQPWINNLAAAHWSDEDARTGRIYQKFLPYLNQSSV